MRWIRTPGFKLLLAGIAAVWLSELFFAAGGMRRWVPLFGGLAIALAGWVEIARRGWRPALAAGALAFASAWLLMVCSPALVQQSYRLFLLEHEEELARAVAIMQPARMEHRVWSYEPCAPSELPARDCAELKRTMRRFGAYGAWKDGPATVFQRYGWVNVHGGILHCPRDACESRRRHIEGAWYFWAR